MVFIDWLTVYQDHPIGTLPVVGQEWVLSVDLAGEQTRTPRLMGTQAEGAKKPPMAAETFLISVFAGLERSPRFTRDVDFSSAILPCS
jgi:hypothetical protein